VSNCALLGWGMRKSGICNESWLKVSSTAAKPVTSPNKPKSLGDKAGPGPGC